MINIISGKVVDKGGNFLVVMTGGIGYKVFANNSTISKISLDNEVTLYTSFVVGENLFSLYGFLKKEEKNLFEIISSVSGVGGKKALSLLTLPYTKIVTAILSEDIITLSAVSGVGKKLAQRIILEIKEKIKKESGYEILPEAFTKKEMSGNIAMQALLTLGYNSQEAQQALNKIPNCELRIANKELSIEEVIKEALHILGKS